MLYHQNIVYHHKSEKNDFEISQWHCFLNEKLLKTRRNLFSKLKHTSSMQKYSQNVRIKKIEKQFTIDTINIYIYNNSYSHVALV